MYYYHRNSMAAQKCGTFDIFKYSTTVWYFYHKSVVLKCGTKTNEYLEIRCNKIFIYRFPTISTQVNHKNHKKQLSQNKQTL